MKLEDEFEFDSTIYPDRFLQRFQGSDRFGVLHLKYCMILLDCVYTWMSFTTSYRICWSKQEVRPLRKLFLRSSTLRRVQTCPNTFSNQLVWLRHLASRLSFADAFHPFRCFRNQEKVLELEEKKLKLEKEKEEIEEAQRLACARWWFSSKNVH